MARARTTGSEQWRRNPAGEDVAVDEPRVLGTRTDVPQAPLGLGRGISGSSGLLLAAERAALEERQARLVLVFLSAEEGLAPPQPRLVAGRWAV